MTRYVEALINPEILVWARNIINMPREIAARKLLVRVEKLESWEVGTSRPTVKQLKKIAKTYKKPFAAFYLPSPPEITLPDINDYRRFPGESLNDLPTEILLEFQESINKREIYIELNQYLNNRIIDFNFNASLNENPEIVGRRLRDYLEIDLSIQMRFRNSRLFFNHLRDVIEKKGVLVFQSKSIDIDDMRGFSISESTAPIIVINRKDPYVARSFTMIHELCHIGLNLSGLCDLSESLNHPPEFLHTEIFCNHVSGATLVPMPNLVNDSIVLSNRLIPRWSNNDIQELSLKFSVSREVILRRLLINGLTDEEFYNQKKREYSDEFNSREHQSGFVPPSTDVISLSGKSYVNLVLDAFNTNNITSSDVSDFLGVRIKHLNRIVSRLTA